MLLRRFSILLCPLWARFHYFKTDKSEVAKSNLGVVSEICHMLFVTSKVWENLNHKYHFHYILFALFLDELEQGFNE